MTVRRWLCAALLLRAGAAAAGDAPDVRVVLALDDQANEIWSALPDSGDDQRVVRVGHTSAACARDALRRVKDALEAGQAGRLALRTLALELRLPRALLKKSGAASTAHVEQLFGRFLDAAGADDFVARARGPAGSRDPAAENALRALYSTLAAARSDHALQPLLNITCPGTALYEIRALADRPGRLFLHMLVEAGSACTAPSAGPVPRRVRVLGQAELEPGASSYDGRGVTLRWRMKAPRYMVLASCAACGERQAEDRPRQDAPAGPCGEPCAPLEQAAAGWGREAATAAEQADAAAARARALETATGRDGKAELATAARLAGEARERAAELHRAADEARATGARCQAQCQARQQPPDAATRSAAGTGGGGIGTTALVLGGVAAAGAGVAVAAGGASEPAPPPPSLEGEWAGIARHDLEFQGSVCTRALDESWSVRRSGDTYTVDISRRETCNADFTCPAGCLGRVFAPVTVAGGTVAGNRFTFPAWHDVFFGPKPCPVTGTFDAGRLSASSTGPCTVLVVPEGPVLHQYRMELNRR